MKKVFFVLMFTLLPFVISTPSIAWAKPIAVIVNKTNGAKISKAQLAKIYKGVQGKWKSGKKIKLIGHKPENSVRVEFYKKVLNAKPTKKFLRPGTPVPIKITTLSSDKSIIKYVKKYKNAIGYIDASKVNKSVKVIMTIK